MIGQIYYSVALQALDDIVPNLRKGGREGGGVGVGLLGRHVEFEAHSLAWGHD